MTRFTSRLAIVTIAAIATAGIIAVPLPASAAGTFGSHIGQALDQCDDNTLAHGDDTVSGNVQLGWTMHYDGLSISSLRVDTNGKVWLGTGVVPNQESTRNPDLNQLPYPAIVPFGSDASTDAAGAGDVTYGVGADGTFCAVWNGVGYFANGKTQTDKLNTFQLIIRPAGDLVGRSAFDFDFTFNYDQIEWDRGGRASAGYTSGNTVTAVELPGSHHDGLVVGDFLENGVNTLIWGHSGSAHPGRYAFSVANGINAMNHGTLVSSEPIVTGGTTVGSTLTAKVPEWGPAPVEMIYVWVRDDQVEIPGDFTSLTYVLQPEDIGHSVRLVAIGFKTNYVEQYRMSNATAVTAAPTPPSATPSDAAPSTAPSTSTATDKPSAVPTEAAPVTIPLLTAGQPMISGTAKLGKTLKVKPGTWTPGAALSYQWFANGKAIKKATTAKLTLTKAVKGKKITVKVTGTKTGYLPVIRMSKATGGVKKK